LNLYLEWKENKEKELKENIFIKLTPMEFYITQGKGTERPFTGDYWDTNKVGLYSCKVCTQRLFR
jgi:peptide methionine sulfoxide reductase MsrB